MSMPVLVAYATTHGHTRLIADRVGAALRDAGLDVELCDLKGSRADPWPPDYAGVVVAASVHLGRHQREAAEWLRRHATTLGLRPSALLSVSLTAADEDEEGRAEAQRLIDELLDESGWDPVEAVPVAGALQYREYDLPTRVLMRLIARRHGQSGDASEDVDFTDWAALEQFAARFADAVARQPGAAGLAGGRRGRAG